MKECNIEDCALNHEGYCAWDLKDCNARDRSDLMTENEYDKLKKQ